METLGDKSGGEATYRINLSKAGEDWNLMAWRLSVGC